MQKKRNLFLFLMLLSNLIFSQNQSNGCLIVSNVDRVNNNTTLYSDDSGGYAAGSNGVGDIAMSERYDLTDHGICYPSTVSSFQVCANVDVGTMGNVTAALWDESGGLPNNIIGSVSQPASSFNLTDQNGDGVITTSDCTTITFSTPITVTSPFYIGLTGLNTLTGGHLGIYTNSDPESIPATAYEQTSSGWMCFDNILSLDIDVGLFVFPTILPEIPNITINLPTSGTDFCNDATNYLFTQNTSICSAGFGTTANYSWKISTSNNNIVATSTNASLNFSFLDAGNYNVELCVTGTSCETNCSTENITVNACCPDNLNGSNALQGNENGTGGVNNNGDYETDGIISSTQLIIGGTVDYDSAIEINMNAGFEVTLGAVFCAFIDGCNSSGGGVNTLDDSPDTSKDQE